MDLEVNGFRMHYELSGEPAGAPVLWLSGWSGTGGDWRHVFKNVPAGLRWIGPDLRGNGASTGYQGEHSFRQSARDVYPPRLALELHEAIPRSSLWVVPNGGHGPVFGPHAARFTETAVAFLLGE
jgi:pimeloyl-ACP methyl ester carboxylesterase